VKTILEWIQAINEMPHLFGIKSASGSPIDSLDLYAEYWASNAKKDYKGGLEFILRLLNGVYQVDPAIDKYNHGKKIEVDKASVKTALLNDDMFKLHFKEIYDNGPKELKDKLPKWFCGIFENQVFS